MQLRCYNHLIFFLIGLVAPLQAAEIRVAAASNLRYVLPELAELFEQQSGHKLEISYAASGTLATQIQHGAPFDVFLSANSDFIERLINTKLTQDQAIIFAQAQLVLFIAKHSTLSGNDGLNSLATALKKNNLRKIAIANPKHAPYGQAAMRELQDLNIWSQIQPFLLMAENASQVVQFSLSTSVDAGFIPLSHAIQPHISARGTYIKLDSYLPQQAILIRGASIHSHQLLMFLETEFVANVLIKHGFIVNKEQY